MPQARDAIPCCERFAKKDRNAMKLFKTDLFRNFAIGFVAGAILVVLQTGPDIVGAIVPQAEAAVLR